MADPRFVAVIDIGKTNAKVLVFDVVRQLELERLGIANAVLHTGPYPHYNIDALWHFIVESLKALNGRHKIEAISIATHGASAALLDQAGDLTFPVLDYEFDGPQRVVSEYNDLRPQFSETGSPRLPNGLNLGAQIFWLSKTYPAQFSKVRSIITYPQYWAYRLCGVMANEATSLGCHTDLWDYDKTDYSSLVDRMGWRRLMPMVRKATDCLGTLLPQLAAEMGLNADTPVYCGIHDSNASLLPHLMNRSSPFAVVSTGTWVISMAIGGKRVGLDPARDTLVNVNAFGNPVPSARFMGGREFELLGHLFGELPKQTDEAAVLQKQCMLLPAVVHGSGPFPQRASSWLNDDHATVAQRQVAASFYLALVTSTCLELAGADGEVVVEGPFVSNTFFMAMLSAATGRPVFGTTETTGTAFGAALLCSQSTVIAGNAERAPLHDERHKAYSAKWQEAVSQSS